MKRSFSGALHCCRQLLIASPRLLPSRARPRNTVAAAPVFAHARFAHAATAPAAAMAPTYEDAVGLLNSTQTGYKLIEERRKAGITLDMSDPIGQMKAWLAYIGHAPRDLDRLNVVHVAGTKGKGTTCAFTNAILERYRLRREQGQAAAGPTKIGLYTSPHLVAVRERIRINSKPISKELFTKYFFEVWQAFEAGAAQAGADPAIKPSYFRFLTLLSFHVFLRERVDAAIYEVGVGGELDATNVFEHPAATAISTLGIDHVDTLGATLDKIAWHKAGILKAGSPAFTVPQDAEAMPVLASRAAERAAPLHVLDAAVYRQQLAAVKLTPAEEFQRKNAALAVSLAATVLGRLGVEQETMAGIAARGGALPAEFVYGLENVVWRGRCETKVTGRQRWYLDGAHNQQSLEVACQWFRREVAVAAAESAGSAKPPVNVLIFNQQSTRDAIGLLRTVHKTVASVASVASAGDAEADSGGASFAYAVFCTNVTYKNNSYKVDFVNKNVDPAALKSLELQQALAAEWRAISPATAAVTAMPTIEDAVDYVRQIEGGDVDVRVLITGSFHLIGGALTILEEGEDFAS